ncbi:hypothetical protein JI741_01080 [Chryseolinea sp. Jin1]|uniref:Uncharacterized protein n=2 Tax=Chryseolinea lacunae TaxID=2801331 RepID=A0ABS1KJZ2_9BACT|nr:hypothetical protein [Chryseolinea lacunae]
MWLRDSTPSPMPWHGEVDIAEKRFKLLRWTGFQKSNITYISHIVIHGKEKTVDDESFLQISFALGNMALFFILWCVLIITIEVVRKPFDFWLSLVVGCASVLVTLFLMVDLNKSENAIDDYIEKIRSQASVKRDM